MTDVETIVMEVWLRSSSWDWQIAVAASRQIYVAQNVLRGQD
jgi:hypothetical protein